MADKPSRADGCKIESLELVRRTCLYVATKLGDLLEDIVLVAFQDRERRTLEGLTIRNERARRDIWVCGPGAFLVLKALAFDRRGENKDAYDLFYVMKYAGTLANIGARLRSLLDAPEAMQALRILDRDSRDRSGVGPRRVAEFLTGGPDDDLQGDVVGLVVELVAAVGSAERS